MCKLRGRAEFVGSCGTRGITRLSYVKSRHSTRMRREMNDKHRPGTSTLKSPGSSDPPSSGIDISENATKASRSDDDKYLSALAAIAEHPESFSAARADVIANVLGGASAGRCVYKFVGMTSCLTTSFGTPTWQTLGRTFSTYSVRSYVYWKI